ncbi:MAG TPA: ribosome rescue protein RqcH [Candidatus Hodarchaeales archaeon]|nr:ribosome rescue protein RqcH [Candidatus Hodarchaeales archaeon]
MKEKKAMSSPDITTILDEILEKVADTIVENIYELNDIYVLKLKGFTKGSLRQHSLLIEAGKRIHLTEYSRIFPERPSNKCLTFRKFLKNGKITGILQLGSDRIVDIRIKNFESGKSYSLFCELFGKGNLIIIEHLDGGDGTQRSKVIFGLWYKVMKDRKLLPGKDFEFPPARGKPLVKVTLEDLEGISDEDLADDVVKVLMKRFGSSGEVVEEILAISKIEKTTTASELIPRRTSDILQGIQEYLTRLSAGPPQIGYAADGRPSNVVPYPYVSLSFAQAKVFPSFNAACDEYFSPIELESETKGEADVKNRVEQISKTLAKQQAHINELHEEMEKNKETGDILYQNVHLIKELCSNILSANKRGIPWDQIAEKLSLGKEKGIASAALYDHLEPNTKELRLSIEGSKLTIDFTKDVMTIANDYYEKSKKAERKIAGATTVISNLNTELRSTEAEKVRNEILAKTRVRKRRDKKWFEQYHWTVTRSGKLVIAGKNAKMNEQLAKRRLEQQDMFLHADIQGAPYTIIKKSTDITILKSLGHETTDDGGILSRIDHESSISSEDIKEAASIAGCYSKAWKAGLGWAEVYSVVPDQVGFTAPTGEYLPKGSIAVSGRREYIKVPLELFIGIYFDDENANIFVSGSETTMQAVTSLYTRIKSSSGSQKKSEIGKKLLSFFEKSVKDEMQQGKLRGLQLNEIILRIP